MIERVIRTAQEAGANEFYVVVGHQKEKLSIFLKELATRLQIPITIIINDEWDRSENGISILKARDYLKEPFLLLMADHLFDPNIARRLLNYSLNEGEIALAVDSDVRNPLVGMTEVTRVLHEGGQILDIDKGLQDFNGLDTGIFFCTPAIFEALEQSSREGETSLSAAVRRMAAQRRAKAVIISGSFWIDIDDPISYARAEKAMLDMLRDKQTDGPVSRYLNRPLSIRISRYLVRYPITPNQVSLFSFICSLFAAFLFAIGGYPALLTGGVIAQFASVIDGCDGEVARLKYQTSSYGRWFDAVLDRYADAFLVFGLSWHGYIGSQQILYLPIGFLAIIGSFMLSYTADKYDRLMFERILKGRSPGLRIGRDVRVFFIFIGAVINQVLLTLVIIALVMNIETIRRIIICREG
jgi:CDP-L-myo-inositol myo-inositolphosphotransferase